MYYAVLQYHYDASLLDFTTYHILEFPIPNSQFPFLDFCFVPPFPPSLPSLSLNCSAPNSPAG